MHFRHFVSIFFAFPSYIFPSAIPPEGPAPGFRFPGCLRLQSGVRTGWEKSDTPLRVPGDREAAAALLPSSGGTAALRPDMSAQPTPEATPVRSVKLPSHSSFLSAPHSTEHPHYRGRPLSNNREGSSWDNKKAACPGTPLSQSVSSSFSDSDAPEEAGPDIPEGRDSIFRFPEPAVPVSPGIAGYFCV